MFDYTVQGVRVLFFDSTDTQTQNRIRWHYGLCHFWGRGCPIWPVIHIVPNQDSTFHLELHNFLSNNILHCWLLKWEKEACRKMHILFYLDIADNLLWHICVLVSERYLFVFRNNQRISIFTFFRKAFWVPPQIFRILSIDYMYIF